MKTPDEYKFHSDIKKTLGLHEQKTNGYLDQALKTVRIEVGLFHPAILKDGKQIGNLANPIHMFKISKKERQRRENEK